MIVSEINNETIESDFSNVGEIQDIYDINEIYSDDVIVQDINDNCAQEIYNDLLSLYCSEIEEDSKNIPIQKITEINNLDDDFEIGECSKNILVPEIIEIIDSDDDSTFRKEEKKDQNQHKEK
ncbi:9544_t:CDS:2 [Cetraspora pellucida]|uniref:9544_t:CDS:1 n=1 Tax=Cetraspora pellucida TaxID=1433469 RepID=A0A9N9FKZ3_9GLOM|nr:9544_t:CDS:2 [Cetraspora pellucida]